MTPRVALRVAIALALTTVVWTAPLYAAHAPDPAPAPDAAFQELPEIVVVGVAPLPGLGMPLDQVPTQVQHATGDDLRRQRVLGLPDWLDNNFSGISINATQGNPWQPDVLYHGFRASPLLGAPEGLSVYVDGVRVNEAVGSTVNWDLIPTAAIRAVTLISGSSIPLYGENTLGGAIALETRDGRNSPGTDAEISYGSFQRSEAGFQTGGTRGAFDYFLAADYDHEEGWRDLSPSTLRRAFGKIGWQDADSAVHVSYTVANNNLIGNGVLPESMLKYRRQAIYTAPDQTLHKLNFVNLTGRHRFSDKVLLSGNVYYRRLATAAFNGDDNDEYEGPTSDCAALARADPGFDDDDLEACAPGIDHASRMTERMLGAGLQLSDSHDLFGRPNRAVIGVAASRTGNTFSQTQQLTGLTPGRATFLGAFPYNDPDINPVQLVNDLSGHTRISGMYLSDTFSPNDLLHITLSARYNHSKVDISGITVPQDGAGDDDDDDGVPLIVKHTFHRLNPAVGITFTPNRDLTLYANYNEGSRAPSAIELGCADPEIPCALPNDFAADPVLKPVVTRTFEVGARGTIAGTGISWNADVFRTRSGNDIQLITTGLSEGYFDNVGDTRRQGFDLGLGGRVGRFAWHATYSYLQATYRSAFTLASEANSSCNNPRAPNDPEYDDDDCLIGVRPGDHIPLIPRNTARVALDYAATDRWNIGANVIMSSGMYLLGNENNANRAGGVTDDGLGNEVIGSGRIGGYTVVNLHTNYRVSRRVDVFARVINLFNRRYATSGFLTDSGFNPDGTFRQDPDARTNENFVAPAAPRAAWLGVRVRL